MIDSGSRYEVAYPSGISHFIEKLGFCVSITLFQSFRLKLKFWFSNKECLHLYFEKISFSCYSQPQSIRAMMKFYKCWLVMEVYVTAKFQGKYMYNQSKFDVCKLLTAIFRPPPTPTPKKRYQAKYHSRQTFLSIRVFVQMEREITLTWVKFCLSFSSNIDQTIKAKQIDISWQADVLNSLHFKRTKTQFFIFSH